MDAYIDLPSYALGMALGMTITLVEVWFLVIRKRAR